MTIDSLPFLEFYVIDSYGMSSFYLASFAQHDVFELRYVCVVVCVSTFFYLLLIRISLNAYSIIFLFNLFTC